MTVSVGHGLLVAVVVGAAAAAIVGVLLTAAVAAVLVAVLVLHFMFGVAAGGSYDVPSPIYVACCCRGGAPSLCSLHPRLSGRFRILLRRADTADSLNDAVGASIGTAQPPVPLGERQSACLLPSLCAAKGGD